MRFLFLVAVLVACSAEPNSTTAATVDIAETSPSPASSPSSDSAINSSANAVSEVAQPPARLTGSRAEQVARILVNVTRLPDSPEWGEARAAFPGARWGAHESRRPDLDEGSTRAQYGTLILAGIEYEVELAGSAEKVRSVDLRATGGDVGEDNFADWNELQRAVESSGTRWAREFCAGGTLQDIRLSNAGRSRVFSLGLNSGTRVATTDYYSFDLGREYQRPTEEESSSCDEADASSM